MNARERHSYADALIQALVRTRDEFNEHDNIELFDCLLRELPRMVDVNNFDGRSRRARAFVKLCRDFAVLRQSVHDYLLEFK